MVSKPKKTRGRAKPKRKASKPKNINQRFIEGSIKDSLNRIGITKLKKIKYNAIDEAISIDDDVYWDEWFGRVINMVEKDLKKDMKKAGLSPQQYKEMEYEIEGIMSDYVCEKLCGIKTLY